MLVKPGPSGRVFHIWSSLNQFPGETSRGVAAESGFCWNGGTLERWIPFRGLAHRLFVKITLLKIQNPNLRSLMNSTVPPFQGAGNPLFVGPKPGTVGSVPVVFQVFQLVFSS